MKEAIHSPYNKLLFRETFNDESTVRRNGGTPTGVTFSNGTGSFNGASSNIKYLLNNTSTNVSIRIRFKINSLSTNTVLIDFRDVGIIGSGFIQVIPSLMFSNSSTTTNYINGVVNPNLVIGSTIEVVCTGLPVVQKALYIGSNITPASWFNGTMDLVEIYSGTLTASEVSNLYNDRWNTELPLSLPILGMTQAEADATGWRGTDEGDRLKVADKCFLGNNCDSSGFSAPLAGYRGIAGGFFHSGSYAHVWSASQGSSSTAWRRNLYSGYSSVYRTTSNKYHGFSLRCLQDSNNGETTFTDPRDGEVYDLVTIGTQTWMKQNLRYLPSVDSGAGEALAGERYYVYGYNGTDVAMAKAVPAYATDGVLYSWDAAIISAPEGFHCPTDDEFKTLEMFVGIDTTKELINFDSTNGVIDLGDLNETFTATDVTVNKNGALWNGSSSKIDLGSEIIGTKDVSIMGWIKPYSFGGGGNGRILNNTSLDLVMISTLSGTDNALGITSNGGTANILSGNNSISLNKLQFVSVTRTAAGLVTFRIGDKDTAPALSGSADQDSGSPISGTTNVIIGNNAGATRAFDGLINKLSVVEGILSLAQITQVWSETLSEIN